MSDVHAKFGLEGKIMPTVTDNGSNFCKSYRQFSPRSGIAATAHRPAVDDMCDLEEVLPPQPQPQPQPQPLDLIEREAGADGGHELDDEIEDDATEYVHLTYILAFWTRGNRHHWQTYKEG